MTTKSNLYTYEEILKNKIEIISNYAYLLVYKSYIVGLVGARFE